MSYYDKKMKNMKQIQVMLALFLFANLLNAQHSATRSVAGGHNQARNVKSEAKKYGVKADAWNWVIPTTKKNDWYAYPIVGYVRDARMTLVYFYDKRMTRNSSDYYYIDEYQNFIVIRWIQKNRIDWQRE